ncbi:hypothetical protein ACWGJX_43665 [Streptomyces sp. NPDC054775]
MQGVAAAAVQEAVAVGGEGVAAGQAGERIVAGGLQLAADTDIVCEHGQGEWHGGRGDDERAGRLP